MQSKQSNGWNRCFFFLQSSTRLFLEAGRCPMNFTTKYIQNHNIFFCSNDKPLFMSMIRIFSDHILGNSVISFLFSFNCLDSFTDDSIRFFFSYSHSSFSHNMIHFAFLYDHSYYFCIYVSLFLCVDGLFSANPTTVLSGLIHFSFGLHRICRIDPYDQAETKGSI